MRDTTFEPAETDEITFEAVEDQEVIPALHKHNSLLHTPFTWTETADA
ncbi:hypothetical protein O7627_32285 [Solwaraspora sp. WMMD1047]|nr:hypothetical protein [Solwaraspora sp. WMMD1047]MDG4833950.1 hypothetical protein [Solwaraspora sp. WMMD1047]